MLLFQRMLLLRFDVLVENQLFCKFLADFSSILCSETFFRKFLVNTVQRNFFSQISRQFCATKLFSQIFRRYCAAKFLFLQRNFCHVYIVAQHRNMKSILYVNFINRMNDDETRYENCYRIFDVLKWTNFNKFEWAWRTWLQNSKRKQIFMSYWFWSVCETFAK